VSTQVEIIYSSSRNSKETGEIFRISPRKSARGIRPLLIVQYLPLSRALVKIIFSNVVRFWVNVFCPDFKTFHNAFQFFTSPSLRMDGVLNLALSPEE
jgi:hypothetical protein